MTDSAVVLLLLSAAVLGAVGGGVLTWLLLRRQARARLAADPAALAAAIAVPATPTPAAQASSPSSRPAAPPRPVTPPLAPLPPLAADVLVVDDSAVARAKLRKLLEANGYSVHLANDGVDALTRLEKGRYAMMISDLEMPNMDGVELIQTCLARPQTARMPILAISGHENLRARFDACSDISGVHRKPWADDVLVSHVATLVGPRRATTAAPSPQAAALASDPAPASETA